MTRSRFWTSIILLLMAATVLVAAARMRLIPDRYNPLAPIDLTQPPNVMTDAKLWMMTGDTPACMAALKSAGVALKEMPERSGRPGCLRSGTVLLSKFSRAQIIPEEMECDMALRLYLLERYDIQPLARQHLGTGVERINHFGSYSCRTIRGSRRMSEHATANAFDISGFKLANGQTITLKKDWTSGNAAARFLRDVRVSACLLFNMVLSPDYNEAHADHFHVDMGWFMGCH